MLDIRAFVDGDFPAAVAYATGFQADPEKVYTDPHGPRWEQDSGISPEDFGISVDDVDTVMGFYGPYSEHDFYEPVVGLQGRFDANAVRSVWNEDGDRRSTRLSSGYEMWCFSFKSPTSSRLFSGTAGLLEHESYNELYMVRENPEVFEQLSDRDEKLLEDPDNLLARALEKAGTGWLAGAWKVPNYCV